MMGESYLLTYTKKKKDKEEPKAVYTYTHTPAKESKFICVIKDHQLSSESHFS